ncbi:MAG: NAD-dependent epimerase/dehydratase family protein [Planctomycetota bacterium]
MSPASVEAIEEGVRPRGRVLVTGATGVIGRRLLATLVASGVATRALVRDAGAASAEALRAMGVELVAGELLDEASLEAACGGCGVVIDLAAATNRGAVGRGAMWRVNEHGPANVWRAARAAGVERVVHVSTTGVYGMLRRWPVDEGGELRPDSVYRRSKLAGDVRLLAAVADDGPAWVVARITSVVGPGAHGNWKTMVDAVAGGRCTLVGAGERPAHVTDIDDIVAMLVRCATAAGAAGRVMLVGTRETTTIRGLHEAVAAALGVEFSPARVLPAWPTRPLGLWATRVGAWTGVEPRVLHAMSFLAGARAYDTSLAAETLGYEARYTIAQAMRRTVEACRAEGGEVGGQARGVAA